MEFTNIVEVINEDIVGDIKESLNVELTTEELNKISIFENLYVEGKISDEEIIEWISNPVNEGVIGSILGGLTGFTLGKKLGKIIAKILGIEKGLLYDLFTSRIFGAALGSSIGKQF